MILAFHPFVVFFRLSELRQSGLFKSAIAGVIFLLAGGGMIGVGVGIRGGIKLPKPLDLDPFPDHIWPITLANPAVGCDFRVEGIDAVRLAMASLGPESWRSVMSTGSPNTTDEERNSRQMIADYVTQSAPNGSLLLTDDLDSLDDLSHFNNFGLYFRWEEQPYTILSFPSTGLEIDLAFVIENVASTWWNQLLTYIIPFDRLIFNVFLNSFQTMVTQTVMTTLFGPRRLTYTAFSEVMILMHAAREAIEYPESHFWVNRSDLPLTRLKLVVGDGAYGLIAKGMAIQANISGVAFNAPQFDSSPIAGLTQWHDGTRRSAWDTNLTWKILNVVAGSALQFSPETKWVTRTNWIWPQWKRPWQSVGAAETFCATVAACATDNNLTGICTRLIGEDRLKNLFTLWGRPVFDLKK
jgi:hypothetical protein